MIPRQRGEPHEFEADEDIARFPHLHARRLPDVQSHQRLTAMLTADTVLQILRGEGYYYGLGGEQRSPTDGRKW